MVAGRRRRSGRRPARGRAGLPGHRTGAGAVPVRRADPPRPGPEPHGARVVRRAAPAAGAAARHRGGRRRPGHLDPRHGHGTRADHRRRSVPTRCSCRSTGPATRWPTRSPTTRPTRSPGCRSSRSARSRWPAPTTIWMEQVRMSPRNRSSWSVPGWSATASSRSWSPVTATHRFDVHLVGAEEYEPYNRILLTEVLAGALRRRGADAAATAPSGSPCSAGWPRPRSTAPATWSSSTTAPRCATTTSCWPPGRARSCRRSRGCAGPGTTSRRATCTCCAPSTTAATWSPARSTPGTPSSSAAECSGSRRPAGWPAAGWRSPWCTSTAT